MLVSESISLEREPVEGPRAHTLGLLGAKGGVGTTVLASSLAWALAQRGQRVVLLDFDLQQGQAALHLCERNAGPTVREALELIERLDDTLLDTLLTPCSPGLRLLPAPRVWWAGESEGPQHREPNADVQGAHLLKLLHSAEALADWVLVDLPDGAPTQPSGGALLQHLGDVVLVTEPTLPATFNAQRAWLELERTRGSGRHSLVLNKTHRLHALPSDQVLRTLGLHDAPERWREMPRSDTAVAQATYQGQAVGAIDPRDPLARALSRWAADLVAGASDDPAAVPAPVKNPPPPPQWRERLMRWAS